MQRDLGKWRKETPATHRSYSEKRNRKLKWDKNEEWLDSLEIIKETEPNSKDVKIEYLDTQTATRKGQ